MGTSGHPINLTGMCLDCGLGTGRTFQRERPWLRAEQGWHVACFLCCEDKRSILSSKKKIQKEVLVAIYLCKLGQKGGRPCYWMKAASLFYFLVPFLPALKKKNQFQMLLKKIKIHVMIPLWSFSHWLMSGWCLKGSGGRLLKEGRSGSGHVRIRLAAKTDETVLYRFLWWLQDENNENFNFLCDLNDINNLSNLKIEKIWVPRMLVHPTIPLSFQCTDQ